MLTRSQEQVAVSNQGSRFGYRPLKVEDALGMLNATDNATGREISMQTLFTTPLEIRQNL